MMKFAGIDFRNLKVNELSNSQLIMLQTALIENFKCSGLPVRNFSYAEKIIRHLKNYMLMENSDFMTPDQKMALAIRYLPEDDLRYDEGIDSRIADMRAVLKNYNYTVLSLKELEDVVRQEKTALCQPYENWQYCADATLWAVRRRNCTVTWSSFFDIGFMTAGMLRNKIIDEKKDDLKLWYSLEAIYLIEVFLYMDNHKEFYLDDPNIYQFYLRSHGQLACSLNRIKAELAAYDIKVQAEKMRELVFSSCFPLYYRAADLQQKQTGKVHSCSL